jgi:hypothetical protein
MKKRLFLIVIFLYAVISGCTTDLQKCGSDKNKNQKTEVYDVQDIPKKTNKKLWIKKEKRLSLYEPKEGCYAGAYILSNPDIHFDISEFERKTGRSHSIYMRNMKLGSPFPIQWVLECIAQMKTPFIILTPPTDSFPFQEFLLEETAKECGNYFIPMFIEFYPNPHQYENPDQYKDFFRKARKIFQKYAPNVAFVWSTDVYHVHDADVYYPGDPFVDWVGLNIYESISIEHNRNEQNLFEYMDFFYFNFQNRKPIMISQLGISHYSNRNHSYYVEEAAQKLEQIYTKVKQQYPRIKAVNYMDFNNIVTAPEGKGFDDFRVTDQEELLKTYWMSVRESYFKHEVDIQTVNEKNEEWLISYYPIYQQDDRYYISENVIKYEWEKPIPNEIKQEYIYVDQKMYYPIEKVIPKNEYIVK